jgi:hypothetical protein
LTHPLVCTPRTTAVHQFVSYGSEYNIETVFGNILLKNIHFLTQTHKNLHKNRTNLIK